MNVSMKPFSSSPGGAIYATPAVAMHWLVALLILLAFPLGLYMHDLPLTPDKLRLYSYHKWLGVTVFGLSLLRLSYRMSHKPPELPAAMSGLEQWLAHAAHAALYLFILVVPLSGWVMSSAMGFQTVWFGLVPLPDLVDRSKELAKLLGQLHQALNWSMLFLVLAHGLAALQHQFMTRDAVLRRMCPWLKG